MFTNIKIAFTNVSKNLTSTYLTLFRNVISSSENRRNKEINKSIRNDWQNVGDDLRRGIIKYGKSK